MCKPKDRPKCINTAMAKKASKSKEGESTVMNYNALADIFLQGNATTLKWLQDRGLLAAEKWCSVCEAPARLVPKVKTYLWVCNSRGHDWSESISANSIFHNSHLSLDRALTLTYWFSRNIHDMRFLANESGKPRVKETRQIVSRWLLRLRKAIHLKVKQDITEKGKIGGSRKIVEMVSRNLKGTWIVGMVERIPGSKQRQRGGELRLVVFPNAGELDSKTVIRVIKKNVQRGTTVMTDTSKLFARLATLGDRPQLWKVQKRKPYYKHAVIKVTGRGFVSDDDCQVHTQTIGSTWSVIKRGIQRSGYKKKHLDCYIAEQMWRRKLRRSGDDSFEEMIRVLSDIHSKIFRRHPPSQLTTPADCDVKPSTLELQLSADSASVAVKTEPVDEYPDCIAPSASVDCKIPEYSPSTGLTVTIQATSSTVCAQIMDRNIQQLAAGTAGMSCAGFAPVLPIAASGGYVPLLSATPPTGTSMQFSTQVVQPSIVEFPFPTRVIQSQQTQPFMTSVQPLAVPFNQAVVQPNIQWFLPWQPQVVHAPMMVQPQFMMLSVTPQMQPSSTNSSNVAT